MFVEWMNDDNNDDNNVDFVSFVLRVCFYVKMILSWWCNVCFFFYYVLKVVIFLELYRRKERVLIVGYKIKNYIFGNSCWMNNLKERKSIICKVCL